MDNWVCLANSESATNSEGLQFFEFLLLTKRNFIVVVGSINILKIYFLVSSNSY